jgi:hypothetical protein
MLRIEGTSSGSFCDNVSRRQFLKVGAVGALTLPQLLAAEAQAGVGNSHKAVIMIYLPGGIGHQDSFDLKMDSPSDIRGEFKPIKTNLPGLEICEYLPKLATIMDKCTVIRSLVGARDEHASNLCMSGYTQAETSQLHRPTMGSVLSRLEGSVDKTVPPFINMAARTQHPPYNDPGPGFAGIAHSALNPNGPMMADMTLGGITLDRLAHRRQLLTSLDAYRRKVDSLEGLDSLSQKAYDILTSSKLVNAMNLDKEDPKVRARYGKGITAVQGDASPMLNEQFLAARRLVEAGARLVHISYGFWDWHGNNFKMMKDHLPHLDQGVHALITDLHERGLDKDVSVIVWGDFGRTPKINKDAGRDHWPRVSCALLAGGGMRHGQVIGSTNRLGEEADDRPIDYKDVFVTLYNQLGIDIVNTPVPEMNGRPNYLFAGHEPIRELV